MALNRGLMTSNTAEWGTPRDFFSWVHRQFRFTVDVCATKENRKVSRFYSREQNGLSHSWEGEVAWCNPPYGDGIGAWLRKGRDEAMYSGAVVVHLVPARVDTDWWCKFVMSYDGRAGGLLRSSFHLPSRVLWLRWEGLITGVYFHDQRLEFDGNRDDGAPFPSALVIHASPRARPGRFDMAAGERLLTEGWPR